MGAATMGCSGLSIDGLIIDLDGTVYRGKQAIDGVREAIEYARALGKKIVFLSNRGNYSRAMCREKLKSMDIAASEEEIILTSTVTAMYLREHARDSSVWVLGDEGLHEELETFGIPIAERPEDSDWLVITLCETLTYAHLNAAWRAVRHGAKIIATNDDKTYPGDEGNCIDVAGMIGAIIHATEASVSVVVGKPSSYMSNAALQSLGLPPERCLVIGDSLTTDMAMGYRAGIRTALVLSGSTNREQAEAAAIAPDFIWESLSDLRGTI